METLDLIIYPIILFLLGILLGGFGFKSKTNNSTETDKYEVTTIFTSCDLANKKIAKMQDDGWRIAGDIYIHDDSPSSETLSAHIIMKRKIK